MEDPRAPAGFMRKKSDETDEPLDGEMSEVIDRLEMDKGFDAIEASLLNTSLPDAGQKNSPPPLD